MCYQYRTTSKATDSCDQLLKEKLAYTVLAASLAYQFGIDPCQPKSRSFHFVVIDEAFGRGSDESATFGLDLFAKMNLQLLVVTPFRPNCVGSDRGRWGLQLVKAQAK